MKYIRPHDKIDCGIACIRMIADHYGRDYSSYYLRKISHLTKLGASLGNLGHAAEQIGFKVLIGQLSIKYLCEKSILPCIKNLNIPGLSWLCNEVHCNDGSSPQPLTGN